MTFEFLKVPCEAVKKEVERELKNLRFRFGVYPADFSQMVVGHIEEKCGCSIEYSEYMEFLVREGVVNKDWIILKGRK